MGTLTQPSTTNNDSQLWVLATIAFAVFYSNYMVPPLIPAFSREFSVPAYHLGQADLAGHGGEQRAYKPVGSRTARYSEGRA
jgi:hypothetical protein